MNKDVVILVRTQDDRNHFNNLFHECIYITAQSSEDQESLKDQVINENEKIDEQVIEIEQTVKFSKNMVILFVQIHMEILQMLLKGNEVQISEKLNEFKNNTIIIQQRIPEIDNEKDQEIIVMLIMLFIKIIKQQEFYYETIEDLFNIHKQNIYISKSQEIYEASLEIDQDDDQNDNELNIQFDLGFRDSLIQQLK